MRTCIYVYFVHLLFNSDLPSIYLIRSGDGRISYSILPRWDFFVHRHKERRPIQHIVIEMSFVRALLRATHFSSAARCYEPLRSEFQFGSALLWATVIWILKWQVLLACLACLPKTLPLCRICNCTENQTFCTSLPAFPSNSTERETCCKFACISICKSTDSGLACILHALAFARVLACVHFQATVLRDRHVCKSTERQTFA